MCSELKRERRVSVIKLKSRSAMSSFPSWMVKNVSLHVTFTSCLSTLLSTCSCLPSNCLTFAHVPPQFTIQTLHRGPTELFKSYATHYFISICMPSVKWNVTGWPLLYGSTEKLSLTTYMGGIKHLWTAETFGTGPRVKTYCRLPAFFPCSANGSLSELCAC